MRFPLCIQTKFFNFDGKFYIDASDKLVLRAKGNFQNVQVNEPVEICLETKPHQSLPWWLSVIKHVAEDDGLFGKASFRTRVFLGNDGLDWTCNYINCETWGLCVANFWQIPLESVIGKRPLHVTIKQNHVPIATVYIQRKQHCVHFH